MKKLMLFTLAIVLIGSLAYAQQDPDDTGIQDSLIIDDGHADSLNQGFINIQIWAVSDDSVAYYNFPVGWNAPAGGVYAGSGTQYFPPLTNWDLAYDTVVTSQSFLRQFGFSDLGDLDNPCLITSGSRVNCWNLRFIILPNTRSQLVVLDTVFDSRSGSCILGLKDGRTEITPAVQRGFISIGVVGVDPTNTEIPTEFALNQNYPNPFNPETNISFSLPKEQNVSLVVFNLLGQQVRTLVNTSLSAGIHTSTWDGRNDEGANVPSGIYFYRLNTSEFSQTNKMVMVR